MKISKKSWHYRLLRLYDWWPPTNLCGYFWKVVLALLLIPVYASGASVIAVMLTAPVWQFFVDGYYPTLTFVGGAVSAGLLTMLLVHLVTERRYREEHERFMRGEVEHSKPRVVREPSLFRLWLRAKHEKVCPTLEFERQ